MKKRHFIVLFLFLSVGLITITYRNAIAINDTDKNKIKIVVQNTTREIGKKAEDSITATLDKAKELLISSYELVKEKGREAINLMI